MTDEIRLPDKALLRQKILNEACREHHISESDLLGRGRSHDLRVARRAVALRLAEAGFSRGRIGQILKRDRTTIVHYFNESSVARKRDSHRIYKLLWSLSPDVREVVDSYASAEGVSPHTVLREWISERARHEAASKARAA